MNFNVFIATLPGSVCLGGAFLGWPGAIVGFLFSLYFGWYEASL